MKSIALIIPTRNRIAKLERTLVSIPKLDYLTICIICDGDIKSYEHFLTYRSDIKAFLVTDHKGSIYCRNCLTSCASDGILNATDDITFSANSIQHAFELFNTNFTDDDGVVGFIQEKREFCPTGIALVGQKFLHRYPNKQLYCPKYFHFGAQEIDRLCQKIPKHVFVTDDKLVIYHYHPSFLKEEIDTTHKEARCHRKAEYSFSTSRKKTGEVWGSFAKDIT